ELVETDARGHRGEPARGVLDLLLHGVCAQPGVLYRVLGVFERAEYPVRQRQQSRALRLESVGHVHRSGHLSVLPDVMTGDQHAMTGLGRTEATMSVQISVPRISGRHGGRRS